MIKETQMFVSQSFLFMETSEYRFARKKLHDSHYIFVFTSFVYKTTVRFTIILYIIYSLFHTRFLDTSYTHHIEDAVNAIFLGFRVSDFLSLSLSMKFLNFEKFI